MTGSRKEEEGGSPPAVLDPRFDHDDDEGDLDSSSDNDELFALRDDQLYDSDEAPFSSNPYMSLNQTNVDCVPTGDGYSDDGEDDRTSEEEESGQVHASSRSLGLHDLQDDHDARDATPEVHQFFSSSLEGRNHGASFAGISSSESYSCFLHAERDMDEPILELIDSDDEELEDQIRLEQERAMAAAEEVDERRRRANLPLETKDAILQAMKNVNLMDQAPEWAKDVPEEAWKQNIKDIRKSV